MATVLRMSYVVPLALCALYKCSDFENLDVFQRRSDSLYMNLCHFFHFQTTDTLIVGYYQSVLPLFVSHEM